ncbi:MULTISPECIES: response regulator [Nostocales]|uniref:Circadian input-output histidine kinase CikA n=3 Tax=Nostocales TaxID=1161 RepID=A0A8S9TG22_9CYAN|nr:response regulator [Tolypothrix bouteillei]KAF3890532.1 response regulator [Tolypothrix bouteillei VB521301]
MSSEQTPLSKGNILVVDDNPANLRLLVEILSKQGYKVRPALNGQLALMSVEATLPDLILLDIIMPEMDGYEVCSRLKASSQTQNIPVIFISASEEVFDKVKAFAVGGVDYISNPFQVEEVLARVEHQLSIRRLSQQLAEENKRLQQEILERQVALRDRKQAELGLRLMTERLQHLLSSCPAIIYSCKPGGNYRTTFISENVKTILGYKAREFLEDGDFWAVHIHSEDANRIYTEISKIFITDRHSHEYRFLHADGTYHWLFEQLRLVRDATGHPIEIVGYTVDITERKQAESALRESEERFRTMADTAPVMIWMSGKDALLNFFNQAWLDFTGRTIEQELGNGWLQKVHQDDVRHCLSNYMLAFSDRKRFSMEYRFLRADGEYRWICNTGIPRFTPLGKFDGYIGSCVDITEHKLAETILRKALETAELANKSKSQFLASMTHELRTPLNVILGFTQVMCRNHDISSEHQEYLSLIMRSGEHLLELIDDILEMSKIEAGRITLNKSSFDLYRLLHNVQEMFLLKAKSKELQLIFERAEDVPQYVQTDEGKLRQVLINLLSNAVKFTEVGSATLRVRLRTGDKGDKGDEEESSTVSTVSPPSSPSPLFLVFEITDTGPGIAIEEINSIFEPFTQGSTGYKSQSGTGLGLPISRKFVELMGGDISVRSTVGQGTTFTFDIPLELAQETHVQISQPTGQVVALASDQKKYRILVVDDEWTQRLLLVRLLTSVGFSIREAENGEQAVSLWSSWEPDLILMDMQMPIVNGMEATQQIKSHLKGQATVIIALTGYAFESNRALVMAAGCDDFISKPFREDVLFKKIARHLGVRYVYEEHERSLSLQSGEKLENLTPAELSVMPAEWQQELYWAAASCADDKVLQLIAQIPDQYGNLKLALADLAKDFRLDRILELTSIAASS